MKINEGEEAINLNRNEEMKKMKWNAMKEEAMKRTYIIRLISARRNTAENISAENCSKMKYEAAAQPGALRGALSLKCMKAAK